MTTPSTAHLGGSYAQGDANTFMPDVWGYLMLRYSLTSMLDLGCGHGHTMKWFADMLLRVHGVEGDAVALASHLVPGAVTAHDYTLGPAPLGDAQYDLGWAAEFVEHVEERFIQHYMADLKRCRLVVITHAEPGQHGHHHVTLWPDNLWIETFAKYGFNFDATETARLRLTDRWHAGWGRRTLMLFHRSGPIADRDAHQFVPLVPIYPV